MKQRKPPLTHRKGNIKTNGTLGMKNLGHDSNDEIYAYKVEETEQSDPIYCISNDLSLQQVIVPSSVTSHNETFSHKPLPKPVDNRFRHYQNTMQGIKSIYIRSETSSEVNGGFRSHSYQNLPDSNELR